jgi:hypothetical protein
MIIVNLSGNEETVSKSVKKIINSKDKDKAIPAQAWTSQDFETIGT